MSRYPDNGVNTSPPGPGQPSTKVSYRVGDDDEVVRAERTRLLHLGEIYDPRTRGVIMRLGIGPGWRCLDVGAGAGTMAAWMADQVGPTGHVLATDVDPRFLPPSDGVMETTGHDIVKDALPVAAFDLINARSILQHLAQREAVLDKLVAALAPGGWIVVQDGDWIQFDAQELPEPLHSVVAVMHADNLARHGADLYWGRRLLPALRARGLEDVRTEGTVMTMVAGEPSAEMFVMVLDRAVPRLVEIGAFDVPTVQLAIAQARTPGFAFLSPAYMIAWGRKAVS
jgi:SAM-dependent methyltransferase